MLVFLLWFGVGGWSCFNFLSSTAGPGTMRLIFCGYGAACCYAMRVPQAQTGLSFWVWCGGNKAQNPAQGLQTSTLLPIAFGIHNQGMPEPGSYTNDCTRRRLRNKGDAARCWLLFRGPRDRMNMRILQSVISGITLLLKPVRTRM